MGGQKITNVLAGTDGTDAVNVNQLNSAIATVDGTTYEAGNGIDITDGATEDKKISVKAGNGITVDSGDVAIKLKDGETNLDVDNTGLSLSKELTGLTSVGTGTLAVTNNATIGGALATTLGDLTTSGSATFSNGASMGGQKITNVLEGEANTDAVNKGQMDTADGTTLTSAKNYADELDKLNVKYNEAKTEVDIKSATFKTTGAATVGSLASTGDITFANGLNKLSNEGISLSSGVTTLTNTELKVGTLTYINADGLNANSKVISGVADGVDGDDAVNMSQLEEYAPNKLVGDGQYASHNYLGDNSQQINMDLTEAVSALDIAIGSNKYSGNNVLSSNAGESAGTYGSITNTISALDGYIGNLTFTGENPLQGKQSSVTIALSTLNEKIGPMAFSGTNFLQNQDNLSGAVEAVDKNLKLTLNSIGMETTTDDKGRPIVSTDIDWDKYGEMRYIQNGTDTIISGMRQLDTAIGNIDDKVTLLDGRVTALETPAGNSISDFSASNISTLNALSNMDMSTANTLASISPNALKAVANLSAENAVVSDSEVMGSSAANSEPTRNPEPGDNYDGDFNVGGTLKVTDDATFDKNVNVGGKLDVKGEANFHEKATFDKDVSIGGTLEMNGNRITGLAAGIEDTDAVNVGQLNEVKQDVADNRTAINTMGNQVNRLSNRIDKVGAGAAALAALHPLDFDPDDKLSFAAGYGNYAGENAVAVGAFYQPNEDTMFSVGGTFGNDENMVNAGVSFKLGQKSNVSRSRVSMAKELVSLRDEVAQLKALMAHAGILPSNGQFDTSALFPDVPENHWAYEYVHELGRLGILEGYADGNFEGDRMMTRYEMAAIVYRAMQKGVNIDSRMLKEFEPELKLIRVDVVARDDDGNPTIERVRVNEDTQQA